MFRLPMQLREEAPPPETPPATGGGTTPSSPAGSDVNWVEESRPAHEEPSEAKPPVTPASPAPTTPAAQPPVKSPAQPAAAVPPTATPPQAQPPVTPAAAPEVTPPVAAPAQPAAATETPAPQAPAVDRVQLRKNEVDRLITSYAMNVEDAQQIITQPEVAMPRLMANLHVSIMDAMIPAIMDSMPAVVHQIMQAGNTHREAEDAFYKAWPVLNEQKYRDIVGNSIRMYRHLNPQATREESIRAAGLSAMITLRLPIPPEMLSAPAPAPSQPAASFTPAAPGASPAAVPVSSQTPNPFVLLNQELDDADGVSR